MILIALGSGKGGGQYLGMPDVGGPCPYQGPVLYCLVVDVLGGSQRQQDGGGERVQPVLELIDLAHRLHLSVPELN